MATMTIEYNAKNKTTRQVIDGLISTGVFSIVSKPEKSISLNLPRTFAKKRKSVIAGMNDYRNGKVISHNDLKKETMLW